MRVGLSCLCDCGRFCVIWGVLWSPHPGLLVPHTAQLIGWPRLPRVILVDPGIKGSGVGSEPSQGRHLLLWLSLFSHKQFLPRHLLLLKVCLWKDSHSCTVHDNSSNIIGVSFDGWTWYNHNIVICCHHWNLVCIRCILGHLHGTGTPNGSMQWLQSSINCKFHGPIGSRANADPRRWYRGRV